MKTQKNRSKLSIRSDSDRIESLFDFRDDVLSARLHHKNHTPYCFPAFFVLFCTVLYYTLYSILYSTLHTILHTRSGRCPTECLTKPAFGPGWASLSSEPPGGLGVQCV